ncbi:Protein-glutamine gamma-glutamyltransferase 2 [Hondaea fermentalgiana]|uniref:Protein-glutamine gamma-glutamyltransferase 2 n=1 Tax=Hondaea fermentalgiana TaxID=2315210 RepID=A0A2R5GK89_9STRA|nr:Protein-glutamine gamma-glutamyltransferase 2 [Hondaea fermentalgiana]|eukprot:GBG31326.1 Protein-glutamine gamma-glutamyltransferase 2 [Hondaea fermentalgiana]
MAAKKSAVAAAAWLVAVLATSAGLAQADACAKVTRVEVFNESLAQHHTQYFDLKENGGFAVRRAQAFEVIVETDTEINVASTEVEFRNDREEAYENPDFSARVKAEVSARKYLVEVDIPFDSPIGKYQHIDLILRDQGADCTSTYRVPHPVYVLFNPWAPEDKIIYLPNETMRQEYVVHEYGNVFQGSAKAFDAQIWHYGQSKQVVLDAAFHLLEKNRAMARDPIEAMQTLSRHQGMQRRPDGSFIWGDDDALMEGNWGDFPFTEKDAPELWTSSVDILMRWKETGKPTKYGQCWVFAALLNTLMRGIGIGSRQLTAFGSWMDASNRHDVHHRYHHVIDEYYAIEDGSTKTIYLDGVAWNYHSWNDVWLTRGDYPEFNGWQSMDGTPPGRIGPAPVRAIHDLNETVPYQVSDVISTVHSTTRTFLVHCQQNHTKKDKLKGCVVDKQLKYDHTGLKLMLTSVSLPNGTFGSHDITGDFIDPNTDARIPYMTDPKAPDLSPRIVLASGAAPAVTAGTLRGSQVAPLTAESSADNLKIVPATYGVTVGSPISCDLDLDTTGLKDDDVVDLSLTATLETYHGSSIKNIYKSSQKVLIKGRMITLPFLIDSSAYLQHDLGDVFIKLVAVASASSGETYFDKAVLDLTSPAIYVNAPTSVVAGAKEGAGPKPFTVTASFRNPLQFPVRNLCIAVHSHVLDFHAKPTNVTKVSNCAKVDGGDIIRISTDLDAPSEPGVYFVLASIQGEYIPYAQSNAVISALPGGSIPSQIEMLGSEELAQL